MDYTFEKWEEILMILGLKCHMIFQNFTSFSHSKWGMRRGFRHQTWESSAVNDGPDGPLTTICHDF